MDCVSGHHSSADNVEAHLGRVQAACAGQPLHASPTGCHHLITIFLLACADDPVIVPDAGLIAILVHSTMRLDTATAVQAQRMAKVLQTLLVHSSKALITRGPPGLASVLDGSHWDHASALAL